jgi:hypothetical protein
MYGVKNTERRMMKMGKFIDKIYKIYLKYRYPDWEDDQYNNGRFKFVWGVEDVYNPLIGEASFNTVNDIEIVYDRKMDLYTLNIKTAYLFKDGKSAEVDYLNKLLDSFKIMLWGKQLNLNEPYQMWMCKPCTHLTASSLPELYTNFKIFVEGYKVLYEQENNDTETDVNIIVNICEDNNEFLYNVNDAFNDILNNMKSEHETAPEDEEANM